VVDLAGFRTQGDRTQARLVRRRNPKSDDRIGLRQGNLCSLPFPQNRTLGRATGENAARSGRVAWPEKIGLELFLPDAEPAVHVNLQLFGKIANRLPEAMWLSFLPQTPEQQGWMLEKVGSPVSPFDVVRGGNRHMHAVSNSVHYKDAHGSFVIETLDAPVVALGEKSPLYFANDQPDLSKGIHVSLFNNAWGTNSFNGSVKTRASASSCAPRGKAPCAPELAAHLLRH